MQKISKKIELRETEKIGKGFFAKQRIQAGQQLLSISDQQFITCDKYSNFSQFCGIKQSPKLQNKTLFAYYLAIVYVLPEQYHKQQHSGIHRYFKILPRVLNGLVNWSDEQLDALQNKQLVEEIKNKKTRIQKQFDMIKDEISKIWKVPKEKWDYRIFGNDKQIQLVTLDLVVYFYSVIQSRAVHYQCKEDSGSKAGALAPYLELFNHSSDPQCEVLIWNQNYIVKTKRSIQAGQEIYVSYGHYEVQKFLQSYGFIESLQASIDEKLDYRRKVAIEYNKIYLQQKYSQNIHENTSVSNENDDSNSISFSSSDGNSGINFSNSHTKEIYSPVKQ